jgi:hypothetical protein
MATEITAKGDLIVGTGSATFDNLAAGSNGDTLVADSSTSTGLRYQSNFAAGKNKIINGDFGIWQRGTSITATATGYFYSSDRWLGYSQSGTSSTMSRQTFTAGTAPVSGYEGTYFLRTVDTAGQATLEQRIEDVRIFAGQTVTLSYWAKSNSSQNVTNNLIQNFGSGGSSAVYATVVSGGTSSVTTSWQRFSTVYTVPSLSGKTIGTNSYLQLNLLGSGSNNALDYWGVQVEAGSVATAFQTATGTIQGELAACQRYYEDVEFRMRGTDAGQTDVVMVYFKTTKRINPSSTLTIGTGSGSIADNFVTGATMAVSGTPYDLYAVLKSSAEL